MSLTLSLDGQNTENVTEHRPLGLIADNKFRWQAHIEHISKSMSKKQTNKKRKKQQQQDCHISSTSIPENTSTTLT